MDQLSLADLAVFARAAALGTLSAAARERGVPVSQVSRAVDRIERACGVALLRRSARGLTLTHDGEAFLAFCQQVTHTRHGLEADLSRRSRQVGGRVRMSLSSAMAQHWVVPTLPGLLARHPHLEVDLLVDDKVVELARDGVDLAIRTGTPSALSMVARPLGHITTGLYASAPYLAQHGTPQIPDDVLQPPHTLLSNCTHSVLNKLRFPGGRLAAAEGSLRSDSTAVLAQMAASGLGIAHLPVRVAETYALQPVLLRSFESAQVPVCALMLPDRQRVPRVRACVDHLVKVFA